MQFETFSSVNADPTAPVLVPPKPASSRMLRVLHVVNGEYYAGAERVQDLLAQHSSEFGIEAGFACVKADQFPHKRSCQEAPLEAYELKHPWHFAAIKKIAAMAMLCGYDILHAHTPRSGWAALSAGKLAGRPVVYTVHDVFLGQKGNAVRNAFNLYTIQRLKNADFVTTVSPESTRLAERLGLGKSRRMILNGVPGAVNFERKMPKDEWVLGSVGLIRPCKGIEVMIEAVAKLKERNCPVKAIIVGTFYTNEYEQTIMKLVKQLGVESYIEFPGFTSDVPSFLKKFDLFVMPSVGPEGLPMVLLEAMAHGLPMIGSNVPGVSDTILDGVDGLIYQNRDHGALADCVEKFVGGNVDWGTMSQAARKRHDREFSARRMAAEFAEVYRSVDKATKPIN